MRTLAFALALHSSLSLAHAAEWIVDDDGGFGVSFTDIQPAIDAAAPGDRIIVLEGQYSGFTLAKGLVIQGQVTYPEYVDVQGRAVVRGVPLGERVLLADLFLSDGLVVRKCADAVLLDSVEVATSLVSAHSVLPALRVLDCADVRFYRGGINGTYLAESLHARGSRVELVQTDVDGGYAFELEAKGGTGILADAGSEVLLSLCSVVGGAGFQPQCVIFTFPEGGDGGDAIHALPGSEVAIHGPLTGVYYYVASYVGAGQAGVCECLQAGSPGFALRIETGGSVVRSLTPLGADNVLGCLPGQEAVHVEPGGSFTELPFEPTLWIQEQGQGLASLELSAPAGSTAYLLIGYESWIKTLPESNEELLVEPSIVLPLGTVPVQTSPWTGEDTEALTTVLQLPPVPPGTWLHFQGAVVNASGIALTNSNVVFVP